MSAKKPKPAKPPDPPAKRHNLDDIHVVEWCKEQHTYHVQTLAEALKSNLQSYLIAGRGNAWVIVAVASSWERGLDIAEDLARKHPHSTRAAKRKKPV